MLLAQLCLPQGKHCRQRWTNGMPSQASKHAPKGTVMLQSGQRRRAVVCSTDLIHPRQKVCLQRGAVVSWLGSGTVAGTAAGGRGGGRVAAAAAGGA